MPIQKRIIVIYNTEDDNQPILTRRIALINPMNDEAANALPKLKIFAVPNATKIIAIIKINPIGLPMPIVSPI